MTDPSPPSPAHPRDDEPSEAHFPPLDPPKPRSLPRNVLPYAVAFLDGGTLLVVSALWLLGLTTARSFLFVLGAIALGALASVTWLFIERQRHRSPEEIPVIAWFAFPLAMLLFFGQMPLIAIAIYPPITEFFEPHERVRAYYAHRDGQLWLDITFPLDTQEQGNNVRLGDQVVSAEFLETNAELFRWRTSRTYSLQILEIERLLDLGDTLEVSVNADAQEVIRADSAVAFRYATGEKVQPFTATVSALEIRRRAVSEKPAEASKPQGARDLESSSGPARSD